MTAIKPRVFLIATMALFLAACGGGGDPAPSSSGSQQLPPPPPVPASSPASAPAPAPLPTIQTFGDSTMHQVGPLLRAEYGLRVSDHSVSGTASSQLIAGTDGFNKPWPQSATYDYAIINHGLNDGLPGGPHQIGLDQYRANLEILAHAPHVTVIFQTPLPSLMPGRDMAPYAQVMREVAAENGLQVIDVFECFQQAPGWQSLFLDGTHPNTDGLQVMLHCMEPTINALK